jgi:hypothetical protein
MLRLTRRLSIHCCRVTSKSGTEYWVVAVKWGSEKVGVQLYVHSHFTGIRVFHSPPAERAGLDS